MILVSPSFGTRCTTTFPFDLTEVRFCTVVTQFRPGPLNRIFGDNCSKFLTANQLFVQPTVSEH